MTPDEYTLWKLLSKLFGLLGSSITDEERKTLSKLRREFVDKVKRERARHGITRDVSGDKNAKIKP